MKAMRTAIFWLAGAWPLIAQNAAPDARELFARVQHHMLETLKQQPNYTCLEAIERATRPASEKNFRVDDVVRLEVALVYGRETFAWPGSKQFEDSDLRTFVSGGMFGTGEFSAFALGVFGGASNLFWWEGQESLGGVATARYRFQVPIEHGMRIRGPRQESFAGYHGRFYVNLETLDLVRLEVEADELPDRVDLRQVTDTIEYARVTIGERDFLLPAAGETVMVTPRGDAGRNRVKFSAYREFTGESKITFGGDADADGGLRVFAANKNVRLPRNVLLRVRLLSDFDVDQTAVGDPVQGALDRDLKVKGKVVLPKGTPILGRIVRVERSPNFTVVGVLFQEAESDQAHAALNLNFDLSEGADVLSPRGHWGTRLPIRPHEGLIPLRAGRKRGHGTVVLWRT